MDSQKRLFLQPCKIQKVTMSNRVVFRLLVVSLLAYELAIGAALFFFDDGALDKAWEVLP